MAIYYSPRIVTDGMVLYLDGLNRKCYAGSGTSLADMSGNNYVGALTNGPVILSDGSISLDGTNDYVDISSSASILSSAAYTKMAFIYPANVVQSNNIISGGNSGQHAFWLGSTSNFRAGHNGSWSTVVSTTSLTANRWAFGAVSFSSSSGWRLYVNGVQEASSVSTTTFTGTGNIYIGEYPTGNYFAGRISCPLVYNRALTGDEVLQNFNALRGRFGI